MLDKGEAEATSRQEVKGRGEQATRRWGPLVSLWPVRLSSSAHEQLTVTKQPPGGLSSRARRRLNPPSPVSVSLSGVEQPMGRRWQLLPRRVRCTRQHGYSQSPALQRSLEHAP